MAAIPSLTEIRRIANLLIAFLIAAAAARTPLQAQVHTNCAGPTCNGNVFVSPQGGSRVFLANSTGDTLKFVVNHTGTATVHATYQLTCTGTSGVSCVGVTPASVVLTGADVDTVAVVTFNLGATSGTLKFLACSCGGGAGSDSSTVTILGAAVQVAAIGGATGPDLPTGGGPYTQSFTVSNNGSASGTYTYTCLTSANVTCPSLSKPSANLLPGAVDTVVATFSVAALGAGQLSLRAAGVATATGTLAFNVVTPGPKTPIEVTSTVNPGATIERGLCFTIALGPDAASECGDLRIKHSLPATKTYNKIRAPTLLYNSAFAKSRPIIKAEVTLPFAATVPTRFDVNLWNCPTAGGTGCLIIATGSWPGTDWVPGAKRQIAVRYNADSLGHSTGIYAQSLEVKAIYPSGPLGTSQTIQTEVVNRSSSPFGKGWWLAGLEQLNVATMVWVGGDGSARQYTPVAGISNSWTAPSVDHPDRLTYTPNIGNPSLSYYSRLLPGGGEVRFNITGQHIKTINRQGQTATFAYTGGLLTTIGLPSPSAIRTYLFNYTGAALTSIVAPPIGAQTRITTITQAGGVISQIQDPDGLSTSYTPVAGTPALIASRTGRRGYTVTYNYDAVGGLKNTGSVAAMGTQPSIAFAITPVQSLGLSVVAGSHAVDPLNAYTSITGPRTDSIAVTKIWSDGNGAPLKIRDAHGFETQLFRGDTRWPGTVTTVVHPNGWRVAATLDTVGNLLTETDFGFANNPTTTFQWDAKWYVPTRATQPEGDFGTTAYDATTGNRLWEKDGRGDSTQTTFGYNATNQVTSVISPGPGTPTEFFAYDSLGNVAAVTSPLGIATAYTSDGIGRVVKTVSPIAGGLSRIDSAYFDILDRDTLSASVGPSMNGVPQQTNYVRNVYNADGQVDTLARWTVPNSANVNPLVVAWLHDPIGRVVKRTAEDGAVDSTGYDPASNVTFLRSRRPGIIQRMTYDALDRLTSRADTSVVYASRPSQFPASFHTSAFNGYSIPQEVYTYAYDEMGRLVEADGPDALVSRTYFLNGWLHTETQKVRTVTGSDFTKHVYTVTYSYDRNGRRTSVQVPTQLGAGSNNTITYGYDPNWGALTQMTDLLGASYGFTYNRRGEHLGTVYPGSVKQGYGYDDDGRLTGDTVWNNGGITFPRMKRVLARATTLQYDNRGLVVSSMDPEGYQDTVSTAYSGLGAVVSTSMTQHQVWVYPTSPIAGCCFIVNVRYIVAESFGQDGLGRRTSAASSRTAWPGNEMTFDNTTQVDTNSIQTGRLTKNHRVGGVYSYEYNAAGDIEFSGTPGGTPAEERVNYYGADGKLRGTDWHYIRDAGSKLSATKHFYEQFRYDALGRRVWVSSERSCAPLANDLQPLESLECLTSSVSRTVWDGSAVLAEIQMPSGTATQDSDVSVVPQLAEIAAQTLVDPNPLYGRVVYAYGAGGTDQPVAATRINYAGARDQNTNTPGYYVKAPFTIVPLWNHRGEAETGVMSTGKGYLCQSESPTPKQCVGVNWPGNWGAYDKGKSQLFDNWNGALLNGQHDHSGLEYRRNRYYDPNTGRFTQEDPLGLAGGLNLYGYAASNPVGFSDPFGLDPTECHTRGNCSQSQVYTGDPARLLHGLTGSTGVPGIGVAIPAALAPIEDYEHSVLNRGWPTADDLEGFALGMDGELAETALPHGNSLLSERAQHLYEIRDPEGNLWKWGVSGAGETKAGTSPRATAQLRGLDKGFNASVLERVPAGPGARAGILSVEFDKVRAYIANHNGVMPPGMKLPKP